MSETTLAQSRDCVNPSMPPTEPAEAQLQQQDRATSISDNSVDVIVINDVGASSPPRRRRRLDVIDLTCTANDDVILDSTQRQFIDLTQTPPDTIPPPSARRVRRTRASGRPRVPLASEQRPATASQPVASDKTPPPPPDPQEWLKCPVCMCTYNEIKRAGQVLQTTLCGHIYCSSCITRCLRTSKQCPTCRKKITPKSIHRIYFS